MKKSSKKPMPKMPMPPMKGGSKPPFGKKSGKKC